MKLKKNEGTLDRSIRAILALVFLYLGYQYSAWWYALAAISAITAATGFCCLYKPFGISTAKK